MTTTASLEAGRRFVEREGRLLERRIAASLFGGEDPAGALGALMGYRNEDGGFGHGLEPDKRAPASQPLDVEVAFSTMECVGRVDEGAVTAACDFLASIGPGVGCLVGGALDFPRAPHWGEGAVVPSLNPTAGIVAHLWRWGVGHPWREAATAFCWDELERGVPTESHTFGEVLAFLDAVPDQPRAQVFVGQLGSCTSRLEVFRHDPADPSYGVTPVHFAPSPASRWLALFDPDLVEAHLDALVAAQCDDGGWPISWETIGPAAVQEYRGVETIRALRTLRSFGRLA
ncbi:MAG: hypothetical protein ACYCU7_09050 [Acidimicrobiales bacterium]